ncbi:MAG: AraC family transcriptional regulator [Chloroflexi bacterium]|nr:MAG: AraC family transcriptional regulator [Chloroflexota bacterium]
MKHQEWSHLRHHNQLNLSSLHAYYAVHAYPRHSHDYYVVALVDQGVQSFLCAGNKYVTPVDGLILLNPAETHTGEPVDESGFRYRAFYPTAEHLETAVFELAGRHLPAPLFSTPRADDKLLAHAVRALHVALTDDADALECESRLIWTLVLLIKQYGDQRPAEQRAGHERQVIRRVRQYIHENYAQPLSLSQLASHVHFSRYYLLRAFRDEVGMPPHAYLESIRIQQAQTFIAKGMPLSQVAHAVGYSSQSHFTRRFKQIIGVTPGMYAEQRKA